MQFLEFRDDNGECPPVQEFDDYVRRRFRFLMQHCTVSSYVAEFRRCLDTTCPLVLQHVSFFFFAEDFQKNSADIEKFWFESFVEKSLLELRVFVT